MFFSRFFYVFCFVVVVLCVVHIIGAQILPFVRCIYRTYRYTGMIVYRRFDPYGVYDVRTGMPVVYTVAAGVPR